MAASQRLKFWPYSVTCAKPLQDFTIAKLLLFTEISRFAHLYSPTSSHLSSPILSNPHFLPHLLPLFLPFLLSPLFSILSSSLLTPLQLSSTNSSLLFSPLLSYTLLLSLHLYTPISSYLLFSLHISFYLLISLPTSSYLLSPPLDWECTNRGQWSLCTLRLW